MRPRTAALALLVAPLVAACTANEAAIADTSTPPAAVAAPAAANTKADEDSIRALNVRWKQMLASKDTAGIGALFADDGAEFSPGMPPARGPAAVSRNYGGMFRMGKDVNLSFDAVDVAVAQSGDLAVERGTYRLSWTDDKGKAISDHGNYVTALKKVNGQWKVLADIVSTEVPMHP